MKHFIAMGGLHGCLPSHCEVYDNYEDAVSGLTDIYELGKRRAELLRKNGGLELNMRRDGNQYVEITECDCDEPWIHDEGITQKGWEMDHPIEETEDDNMASITKI